MPVLSIIVPVYNSAIYLNECVNSLLNQTLEECEFIIVNDGSVDESLSILEKYREQDDRIVIISQYNQGVSAARNTGLSIAKGEYVGFVDADDYVEKTMFETLYNTAKKLDVSIVTCGYTTELDGVTIVSQPNFPFETILYSDDILKDVIPCMIREDVLNSCCTKIYKREFLETNSITFPLGVANGEDGLFNCSAFFKADSVVFIDYYGYLYRNVEGSATRNIASKDYFQIALESFNLNYNNLFENKLDESELKSLQGVRLINTVFSLIHIYFKPNKNVKFLYRFNYVKSIIENNVVQECIEKYFKNIIKNTSTYQKFILNCIRFKSMTGLVLATQYSNYRNKK